MKLPNGYGSVFKLSGNRRKPWAVRVLTGYNLNGSGIYKYIGYFKTKSEGLNCLADYHNNIEFYNKTTLEQIYINWSKIRFNKISAKTISMYEYAWTYLEKIKDMDIQDIRKAHLQDILQENDTKSRSTHKQIKSLAVQLFKEALENGLVKQNYAEFMEAEGIAPEQKEIFTDAEIYTMLNSLDVPNIDIPLILIFTGYRIGELCDLTKFNVDLKSRILRGGNKTEAGKKKIVGIHNSIYPLILKRYNTSKNYLIEKNGKKVRTDYLREYMFYPALKKAGIKVRNPHTCRHTFASLLNRYVDDKQLLPKLMGHTDLKMTAEYTHADFKQMHDTVNLIKL